ncbi:TatD family hydrolase [Ihubacter sp. mB4P-1]|uniref:TatD family hydrolase n=1 Tax=Ihubacter sp. mB4P-1 TaxID=3242370 RepID=UPI00137AC23A
MLFDSHTHINNENYTDEQRQALIEEIAASDVSYVMDVGFDLESSMLAVKHAQANSWCYAAVGFHPHDAKHLDEDILVLIKGLAKKDKVQAIGEIGLDFHYDLSERDVQRYWFRRQIQLANELKMPIVIHSREADQETMDILKEEGAFSRERQSWFPEREGPDGNPLPDSRVLLHCFSGSKELARQYVKLGATLSICGPVTFKNNRKTQEVVREIPIEFLLVETDAPYLTPEPFRGRPNKSPYVEHTARRVAVLKGIPYEDAARITCENAKRFYNITI